jgi:hypothetical protein
LSLTLDLPFGISDLDKVFSVVDLLDNREVLINEFKPEVSKYIVKDGFFKGVFRRRYQQEFDNLIVSLIRRQLIQHFPSFTPEEIVLLTDVDFLKMITSDFYFEPKNYEPNERGPENVEH